MDYEDFSIRFGPRRGHVFANDTVFRVVARSSGGGSVPGKFRVPFDRRELGALLYELGDDVHQGKPGMTKEEIGRRLFDALFRGRVRRFFDKCWGRVEDDLGRGLRIRLCFDLEDQDLIFLTSLPWELLFSQDDGRFLSFSPRTPVVRHLNLHSLPRPRDLEPPLRVLVASSRASAPLDVEAELRRIEETWGRRPGIETVFLDRITLPELRRVLAEGDPFHALHFIGHGAFDDATSEGTLIFQDAEGRDEPVSGRRLGMLLHSHTELRLVFLNACDSARTPSGDGRDPFAGVATALLRAEMPTVVAMQFPISDQAAVAFSGAFYEQMAVGRDLETATTEGRKAVLARKDVSREWAAPVLFERSVPASPKVAAPEPSGVPKARIPWRGLLKAAGAAAGAALLPVLGFLALHSREDLLGLDEHLSYSLLHIARTGVDVLTSLPRNALWALFCGETWLAGGAWGLLATLAFCSVFVGQALPADSPADKSAGRACPTRARVGLALTWVVLLFGVRFYQVALYPPHSQATAGPAFDVAPGGSREASTAFEVVSWLQNDQERNEERRQALAGLVVWFLLVTVASGRRAWYAGLPPRWRGATVAGFTLLAVLVAIMVPRAHAMSAWGLTYPELNLAPDCRNEHPELTAALESYECCLFAVSTEGHPWRTLLWGGGCSQPTGFQTWSEEQRACFILQQAKGIDDDC